MDQHVEHQSCDGSALLLTLLVTATLAALGLALATLTDVERLTAANQRDAFDVTYAADAAAEEVVQELASLADWNTVLAGAVRSPLFVGSSPVSPWGTAIDLSTLRRQLQRRTDAARPGTTLTTVWVPYLSGAVSSFVPAGGPNPRAFIAAWVGDDGAETDADPARDSNGVILIRTLGIGPRGMRAEREVSLERPTDVTLPVRVTAWRDAR